MALNNILDGFNSYSYSPEYEYEVLGQIYNGCEKMKIFEKEVFQKRIERRVAKALLAVLENR